HCSIERPLLQKDILLLLCVNGCLWLSFRYRIHNLSSFSHSPNASVDLQNRICHECIREYWSYDRQAVHCCSSLRRDAQCAHDGERM
ncbi:hypothetical protein PENTCL1PPCAC_1562, partial [Pristionchus entomophagus]